MGYLVVGCSGCGTPRVAEADKSTAQCPRCGTTIQLDKARIHARTDELAKAQDAVGQVNAQRAGGELVRPDRSTPAEAAGEETDEADEGGVEPSPSARDDIDRALAQAREVSSERMRVRLTAEGLTQQLGTFTEEDWLAAMDRLDVSEPRAREHLQRLSLRSIVAEPEHGTYRYIE
ncbi:hypothetical protein BRD56_06610 [Thermoplasmatales archaeon SW_10_69_26]|nr:MAG: hypothetical protein BRD56_06610 [Thermoplasmatales archaeon SW_10_69_26]